MFTYLKRLITLPATGGTSVSAEDDAELREELAEGEARVRAVSAAGVLPVLDTQHRAIGADVCHLAVPASRPDAGDAPGKLFVTNRRVIFSGAPPVSLSIGSIVSAAREVRDVTIIARGDASCFRCNSFGDAMLAVWLIDRLRKGPSS